ncbi:hypothetical protein DFH08DRAFT_947060 [Mycena albidolilacea]|uniref:EF-hand domain-containing protein n=1 Tax=Mycena albidolilacea TaxID=1033008 RepID=A0AAD7AUC8_9AGAR|nr:hypothetical protein DFH08DRAFT_947060 [Mycena albidolilacea]
MSYSRYDYDSSDSDSDDLSPPPPPPPARYGTGPAPTARRGYSDEPSYGYRQTQPPPPPPPSLRAGGSRYATPPPAASSYRVSPPPSTYHSPPPTSTYQSPPSTYRTPPNTYQPPPAGAYRESTPPRFPESGTQPTYSQPPTHYNQAPSNSYNQASRDYSQVPPPPPPGAYRGGSPASGGYRASPPASSRGSQPPPSAYNTASQTARNANAPTSMRRVESYSEDYSAYGISTTSPRPQTGRFNTEDMSGRISNQNAEDLETSPAFDRRKTEQMALTIGANVKRDEASMAAKIGELVVSGSEKLEVAQSIIDKVIENDTVKLAKEQAEAILSPAKDVIAFLDVLKNIHPVVGAVTTIFTALIKLETDRRDNDKSIAVLHLAMTNLLFVLSYLQPTFDTADRIKSMLQSFLDGVCRTMNQFGNFCDVYYKQRGIVKMIRSSSYKTKLAGYATAFEDHKKDLRNLMITKTAATVTKMDSNVKDVSAKLDQVLAFINMQSRKEVWIGNKIQELGGEEKVVMDDKLLAKIGKVVKEDISSQIKYALRENIDDVIKSNFARFNLKVETAMNEIKDAVQRSTETILTRLDSGPHDLIQDEDIKAVWKGTLPSHCPQNWRLSCKSRHFVDAVHHHFAQKFAKYTLKKGEPHPERWTLKFLSNIIFYPAIGDAIDEDGSGYLSVHEVDRFCKAKPKDWTTTQWMAYWAAGWYLNAVSYRHRCMALIDAIQEASAKVMPQNKTPLKPYLKKECYGEIHLMLEGLYVDNLQYHGEGGVEYESLDKFRRERMDVELTNMKAHLAKPNYDLDSKEAVLAVLGTPRVEVSVLPLLFLVLRRHKKIIDIASTLVLEEMEFDSMVECIKNISEVFETRFRNLLESWRQQRLDTKYVPILMKDLGPSSTFIGCFSGGIFEAWHEEFHDAEADSDSDWDSDMTDSDDEEYKEAERAAHAEDASEPRRARDVLLYGIPYPQPTSEETRMLKESLEARKAKKKAKKEEREASLALADSDGETGYDDKISKAGHSK